MNSNQNGLETQIQRMYEQREKILLRSMRPIQFSRPIIYKEDLGIIFPNTITTIQGKKGVHKSRLTETLCARILDRGNREDHLGLELNTKHDIFLLYVDTERNQKDQFPYAIQMIRKKSGHEISHRLEKFDILSLINVNRTNRFAVLKSHIERLQAEQIERHIVIVFDVITDCIGSFNDVNESMNLIDLMNELINTANVSFISVIHENPTGEKARGHLGTEIINKSSQVIQISKDEELIKVKFLHSRNTGTIPEWYLEYDEETRGLIHARQSTVDQAKAKAQTAAPLSDLKSFLVSLGPVTVTKEELFPKIRTRFDVSDRTLETRLKELEESQFFTTCKISRTKYYNLNEDRSVLLNA